MRMLVNLILFVLPFLRLVSALTNATASYGDSHTVTKGVWTESDTGCGHYTSTLNSSVGLTFNGVSIHVLGDLSLYGGLVQITLDGQPTRFVDLYGTARCGQVLFSSTGLANGQHFINLELTGESPNVLTSDGPARLFVFTNFIWSSLAPNPSSSLLPSPSTQAEPQSSTRIKRQEPSPSSPQPPDPPTVPPNDPPTVTPADPPSTPPPPPTSDPPSPTLPPPTSDPPSSTPPPPTSDPPSSTPPPPTSDPPSSTPPPPTSDPPSSTPPPVTSDPPSSTPPPATSDPPSSTPPPSTSDPLSTPPPSTSDPLSTPPPSTSDPLSTPPPSTSDPLSTPPPTATSDPLSTLPTPPTTSDPPPASSQPRPTRTSEPLLSSSSLTSSTSSYTEPKLPPPPTSTLSSVPTATAVASGPPPDLSGVRHLSTCKPYGSKDCAFNPQAPVGLNTQSLIVGNTTTNCDGKSNSIQAVVGGRVTITDTWSQDFTAGLSLGGAAQDLILNIPGRRVWENSQIQYLANVVNVTIPPKSQGALVAQVTYNSTNGTLQIGNELPFPVRANRPQNDVTYVADIIPCEAKFNGNFTPNISTSDTQRMKPYSPGIVVIVALTAHILL